MVRMRLTTPSGEEQSRVFPKPVARVQLSRQLQQILQQATEHREVYGRELFSSQKICQARLTVSRHLGSSSAAEASTAQNGYWTVVISRAFLTFQQGYRSRARSNIWQKAKRRS